jgi:hypothetical protein
MALSRVFAAIQVLSTFFSSLWALRDTLDVELAQRSTEFLQIVENKELVENFFTIEQETIQELLNKQFIPGPEDHPVLCS